MELEIDNCLTINVTNICHFLDETEETCSENGRLVFKAKTDYNL